MQTHGVNGFMSWRRQIFIHVHLLRSCFCAVLHVSSFRNQKGEKPKIAHFLGS